MYQLFLIDQAQNLLQLLDGRSATNNRLKNIKYFQALSSKQDDEWYSFF